MPSTPITINGQPLNPIGLGCVTFGREIDEDTSFRLLDYALAKGINLLDTAESYGGGQSKAMREQQFGIRDNREVSSETSTSEKIIGRWLKSRKARGRVVICTKVRTTGAGGSADSITAALHGSLDRLGIDYVDIYMMHNPDEQVPIDETLAELKANVDKGLIRTIGASNYSADQMRQALTDSAQNNWPRFDVIQPPYSLIVRDADEELFALCLAERIAVTAFSPLCQGFLSGKYTRDAASIPKGSRFDILPTHGPRYFTDRNFEILSKLRSKAEVLDVPMVRLAVAWVMSHEAVTSTLIGARTEQHVDNALEALKMKLDPDARAEMSAW